MKFLKFGLFIGLFLIFIINVSAIGFYGYTLNATGTYNAIGNTSVKIYEYTGGMGPGATLLATYENYSNSTGFFNISNITFNTSNSYKPVIRHYYGDYYVDYMGQSLPAFPGSELTNLNNITFYLKEAATINISAIDSSGDPKAFNYFIKDIKLGYPVAENFSQGNPTITNVTVHLPADRNYSIALYPYQSMPIVYELNNLSDYNTTYKYNNEAIVVNINFNTTNINKGISGYVLNSSNMNESYDNLTIVAYIIDPGNMLFKSHPMPYNMSQWNSSQKDYINLTGEFKIQVPGSAGILGNVESGTDVMLFAIARKGSNYYGAFKNITLKASQNSVTDFNLTLQELLGSASTLSISDAAEAVTHNFTLKELTFKLYNASNDYELNVSLHIEIAVDYSSLTNGPRAFSWMVDTTSNSTFRLPMFSSAITIQIFSNDYLLKEKLTIADLTTSDGIVKLNVTPFNPGGIEEGDTPTIYIELLKNSDECNVPYPPSSCSLTSTSTFGVDFNPLGVIMGGGKLNFKIRNQNNITVVYNNVDLLASGPPDAMFDSNANESSSGASLEEAWRFGSKGPEIYDDILIGIPYNDSLVDELAPFSILISKLLDNDWNHVWNVTSNTTAQVPSDYSAYNTTWFNTTINGMPCTTNINDECYINTTHNMLWLKIPHFSGFGPITKTTTKGNFSISTNASEIECKDGCIVYINASNNNYTLSQSLQNITINNTDSGALVKNFSIYWYNNSNSSWQLLGVNGTTQPEHNISLSNGSASTISRYRININKSKGATTLWNFTYFVSGMNDTLSLELNLTCTSVWTCGAWSTCISSERTRTCTDSTGCNTSTRTETTSCSSGSTSSGGGGSSTRTSKTWLVLEKGETATMSITSSSVHLRKISVEIKREADKMKVEVSKSSSEPSSVNVSIEGEVYQYLKINDYFVNNTVIDSIEFEFRVEKSWLSDNNVEKEDVVLMHYKDDKWEELSTEITGEDSTYINYKATSSSFSYYAIAQKVEEEVIVEEEDEEEEVIGLEEEEVAEEEEITEEESTEEGTITKKKLPIPLWSIITLVIIFIGFVVTVAYYVRKQQRF